MRLGSFVKSLAWNTGVGMLVMATLAACGRNDTAQVNSDLPTFALPANTTRLQFIEEFPVLDQNSNLQAPQVPTGGSPIGVVLAFLPDGTVSYCTTTHFVPGKIVTNAHCVESDSNPNDYYVLFYNTSGKQISTGVTSFEYVGSSQTYDIAVLDIPVIAAEQWSSAGDQVASLTSTTQVTIWSFDPISNYADLYNQYNQHAGMKFNPKTCLAGRKVPTVLGYTNGSSQPTSITSSQVNPVYHIVMDNCNQNPVHGNSGSLITLANNFAVKFGVYHWGIGLSPTPDPTDPNAPPIPPPYYQYVYTGNAGQQILTPTADLEFYQVGTAFDYINQYFPGHL